MEVVIDASALIAVIGNEPEKERLISLTRDAELIAPLSVHSEIGNAFSAMLKRGRITLPQCLDALTLYDTIPIRFVDIELALSMEIASELGIYAYDAYLIRCAEKHRAPLLTLDRALQSQAKAYAVQVMEIPE